MKNSSNKQQLQSIATDSVGRNFPMTAAGTPTWFSRSGATPRLAAAALLLTASGCANVGASDESLTGDVDQVEGSLRASDLREVSERESLLREQEVLDLREQFPDLKAVDGISRGPRHDVAIEGLWMPPVLDDTEVDAGSAYAEPNEVYDAVSFDEVFHASENLGPIKVRLLNRNVPGNTVHVEATATDGSIATATYGLAQVNWVNGDGMKESLGELATRELISDRFDSYPNVLPFMDVEYEIQEREAFKGFILREPPPAPADYLGDEDDIMLEFVEQVKVSDWLDVTALDELKRYALPVDIEVKGKVIFGAGQDPGPIFGFDRPYTLEPGAWEPTMMDGRLILDHEGEGVFITYVPYKWLRSEDRNYPITVDPHITTDWSQSGWTCYAQQKQAAPFWRTSIGSTVYRLPPNGSFAPTLSGGNMVCAMGQFITNSSTTQTVTMRVYKDGVEVASKVFNGGAYNDATERPNEGFVSSAANWGHGTRPDDVRNGISCEGDCVKMAVRGSPHLNSDCNQDSPNAHLFRSPDCNSRREDSDHRCGVFQCVTLPADADGVHEVRFEVDGLGVADSCRPTVDIKNCNAEGDGECTSGIWNREENTCSAIATTILRGEAVTCDPLDSPNQCVSDTSGACQNDGSCVADIRVDQTCDDGQTDQGSHGGNPCTEGIDCDTCRVTKCNAEAQCVDTIEGNGAQCFIEDDGNPCTLNTAICSFGKCLGRGNVAAILAKECQLPADSQTHVEGNPAVTLPDFACTLESGLCDGSGGCARQNVQAGVPCVSDDSGECIALAQCDGAGTCNLVAPHKCDDPTEGLEPGEKPASCSIQECVPGQGCQPGTPLQNGIECDPGNFCEVNGSCLDGDCKTQPRDCASELPSAPGECELAGCNETTDQCVFLPKPEGTPCTDDGFTCTAVDACSNGVCEHVADDSACADDGNDCTIELCSPGDAGADPGTGCVRLDATNNTECNTAAGGGSGTCQLGNCVAIPLTCGDGNVDAPLEECDEGANNGDDGTCLANCRFNVCGDGLVDVAEEQCDDGNNDDDDGCANDCQLKGCGDGNVNPALGEECDPAAGGGDPNCTPRCTVNTFGDGFAAGGEDCDRGTTTDINDPDVALGCKALVQGSCGVLDPANPGAPAVLNHSLCFDGDPFTDDTCKLVGGPTTICQNVSNGNPGGVPGACGTLDGFSPEQLAPTALNGTIEVYEGHSSALIIDGLDLDQAMLACSCQGRLDVYNAQVYETTQVTWNNPASGTLIHGNAAHNGTDEQGLVAVYQAPMLGAGENSRDVTVTATVSDSGAGLVDDGDGPTNVTFTITVKRREMGVLLDEVPVALGALPGVDAQQVRAADSCTRTPIWTSNGAINTGAMTVESSAAANGIVAAGQPVLISASQSILNTSTVQTQCGSDGCPCTSDRAGKTYAVRELVGLDLSPNAGRVVNNRTNAAIFVPPTNIPAWPGFQTIDIDIAADDSAPHGADDPAVDLPGLTYDAVSTFYIGNHFAPAAERVSERLLAVRVHPGSYVDGTDGKLYGSGTVTLDGATLPDVLSGLHTKPNFPNGTLVTFEAQFMGIDLEKQDWGSLQNAGGDIMVATSGMVAWTGARRSIQMGPQMTLHIDSVTAVAGVEAIFDGRLDTAHGMKFPIDDGEITGNLQVFEDIGNLTLVEGPLTDLGVWGAGKELAREMTADLRQQINQTGDFGSIKADIGLGGAGLENINVNFEGYSGVIALTDVVVDLHGGKSSAKAGYWTIGQGGQGLSATRNLFSGDDWGTYLGGDIHFSVPGLWDDGTEWALPFHNDMIMGADGLNGALAVKTDLAIKLSGFAAEIKQGSFIRLADGALAEVHFDAEISIRLGGTLRCFAIDMVADAQGRFIAELSPCDGGDNLFSITVGAFDIAMESMWIDLHDGLAPPGITNFPASDTGVYVTRLDISLPAEWGRSTDQRPTVSVTGLLITSDGFEGTVSVDNDIQAYFAAIDMGVTLRGGSTLRIEMRGDNKSISGEFRVDLTLPASLPLAPGESRDLSFFAAIDKNGDFFVRLERFPKFEIIDGFSAEADGVVVDMHRGLAMGPGFDASENGFGIEKFVVQLPDLLGNLKITGSNVGITGQGLSGDFEINQEKPMQLIGFSATLKNLTLSIRRNVVTAFEVTARIDIDAFNIAVEATVGVDQAGRVKVVAAAYINREFTFGGIFTIKIDRIALGLNFDGLGFFELDGGANLNLMQAVGAAAGFYVKGFRVFTDGTTDFDSFTITADVDLFGFRATINDFTFKKFSASAVREAIANLDFGEFITRNLGNIGTVLGSFNISDLIGGIDLSSIGGGGFGGFSLANLLGRVRLGSLPFDIGGIIPPEWNLRFILSNIPSIGFPNDNVSAGSGGGNSLWDEIQGLSLGDLFNIPQLGDFTVGGLLGNLNLRDILRGMSLADLFGGLNRLRTHQGGSPSFDGFEVDFLEFFQMLNMRGYLTMPGLLGGIRLKDLLGALPGIDGIGDFSLWDVFDRAGKSGATEFTLGSLLDDLGINFPDINTGNWKMNQLFGKLDMGPLFEDIGFDACYIDDLRLMDMRLPSGDTVKEKLNEVHFRNILQTYSLSDLGLQSLEEAGVNISIDAGGLVDDLLGNPRLGNILDDRFGTINEMLGLPSDLTSCIADLQQGECIGDLDLNKILPIGAANQTIADMISSFGQNVGTDLNFDNLMGTATAKIEELLQPGKDLATCIAQVAGDLQQLDFGVFLERLNIFDVFGELISGISLSSLQDALLANTTIELNVSFSIASVLHFHEVDVTVSKKDGIILNRLDVEINWGGVQARIVLQMWNDSESCNPGEKVQGFFLSVDATFGGINVVGEGAAGTGCDAQGEFEFWWFAIAIRQGVIIPIVPGIFCLTGFGGGMGRNFVPLDLRSVGGPGFGPKRIGWIFKAEVSGGDCAGGKIILITGEFFVSGEFFAMRVTATLFRSSAMRGGALIFIPFDGSGIKGEVWLDVKPFPLLEARGTITFQFGGGIAYIGGRIDGKIAGLIRGYAEMYYEFHPRFVACQEFGAEISGGVNFTVGSLSVGIRGHVGLKVVIDIGRREYYLTGYVFAEGWFRLKILGFCVVCASLSIYACFTAGSPGVGATVEICYDFEILWVIEIRGCGSFTVGSGCIFPA